MKKEFICLVIGLILASCNGNKKNSNEQLLTSRDTTVQLKPYNIKVKGYLSDVLEIVDGTYSLEHKAEFPKKTSIQIKIKSISKRNKKDYGLQDGNDGPLSVILCNKDGMPYGNFPEIRSSYTADGLLKDMMSKSDENWILFESNAYHDNLPKDCATFIITSKEIKEDTSDSDDNATNGVFSNEDNPKWDKVLDDYEAYVDKYLDVIKKSKNDDSLEALLDYPELLEKTKKLEESLEEAKTSNSLSAKQVRRMAEIQVKMINAVSEMEADDEL